MKYNYYEAIKNDVLGYITENYTSKELNEAMQDREAFEEELNDALWVEDSVTGNASGSYTFNGAKAKEYILSNRANLDILRDAAREFCCEYEMLERFFIEDWEYFDVTIRCYLLYGAISEALNEIENELEKE